MTEIWTLLEKNEEGCIALKDGSFIAKRAVSDESALEAEAAKYCYLTEQHLDWCGSKYGDKAEIIEDEEDIRVSDCVLKDGKLIGFCPLHSRWDIENHRDKFYISLAIQGDTLIYNDPYPLSDGMSEGESWNTYTRISLIKAEDSDLYNE